MVILSVWPFAVPSVPESRLSLIYELLDKQDFYAWGAFSGEGKLNIRYAKFGSTAGQNGSLLFVNGKGENLFKYIELFYDLHRLGWSPIYSYDHRGQGFSDRVFPEGSKKVMEDYTAYRKDLETFVQIVLRDRSVSGTKLFMIAHSMGGTIALDYLRTHTENQPFKAVVLSSPMIGLQSHLWGFMEDAFLAMLTGYCSLSACTGKMPSLRSERTYGTFTNSKARYMFSEHIVRERFLQARSSGTSLRWLVNSFKASRQLMETAQRDDIRVPFMILQSEEELFVQNKNQDRFCSLFKRCCHLRRVPGKHEIFMEKDEIRGRAVFETASFFLTKDQKKCLPQ